MCFVFSGLHPERRHAVSMSVGGLPSAPPRRTPPRVVRACKRVSVFEVSRMLCFAGPPPSMIDPPSLPPSLPASLPASLPPSLLIIVVVRYADLKVQMAMISAERDGAADLKDEWQ